MINKITQIVSLSRFKHFSSTDNKFSLSQANLLYAPNGRGKTSIADIICSLVKNDPDILLKRASKVYPGNLEVTLIHGSPSVTSRFTNSVWTNPPAGINCLVFDKAFIQQNIHTISVDHEHKKKLHGLIVGEGAIEAKAVVTKQREELADAHKNQRGINGEFAVLGAKGIALEDFIKLPTGNVINLEAEKTTLKKQLEALGNPEQIKETPVLSKLNGLSIEMTPIEESCSSNLTGASKEAVELVQNHVSAHIHGSDSDTKAFIAGGVKALGNKDAKNCALCGQVIGGEAEKLIGALFTVFSADYLKLQQNVNESIDALRSLDIKAFFSQVSQSLEVNKARHTGWSKFVDKLTALVTFDDADGIKQQIHDKKEALITILQGKLDSPSNVVVQELTDFKQALMALENMTSKCNKNIEAINTAIDTYKASLDVSKKQPILTRIAQIDHSLIRSSEQGQNLSSRYIDAIDKVEAASKAYKDALASFSKEQQGILDDHGDEINKILTECGAKFKLDGLVQGTHSGSTEPYLEYTVKLSGGSQESQATAAEALGDILSEGEKNLLAFSFFWSLIQHSTLSETVAIFDDPLSSVDEAWRFHLIDKLRELCNNGLLQLFVLTHYGNFARVVALRLSGIKQLTIEAGGSTVGNSLASFDIETESKEIQFARIDRLKQYIDDPTTAEPKDIQADIRNTLEAALKYKYYLKLSSLIDAKKWLRDFIDESSVKPILEANGTYETLETLCTNGGWANHDNPSTVIFNQDQAVSYAQQTLNVLEKL